MTNGSLLLAEQPKGRKPFTHGAIIAAASIDTEQLNSSEKSNAFHAAFNPI